MSAFCCLAIFRMRASWTTKKGTASVAPLISDGGIEAALALAGGDALDGVGGALASTDLHVEALVGVPALLERGVVRHVLAGRHEVEDERIGLERLRLRGAVPRHCQQNEHRQERERYPSNLDHHGPPRCVAAESAPCISRGP